LELDREKETKERERERKRVEKRQIERNGVVGDALLHMCLCEREKERERERGKEGDETMNKHLDCTYECFMKLTRKEYKKKHLRSR